MKKWKKYLVIDMHPDTVRMYINCIRTIFTKENYRKFLQMYGKDGEMAKKWVIIYHKLGRDEKKTNYAFELFTGEKTHKVLDLIDKLIELNKKKIEILKRIREGLFYKIIEEEIKNGMECC